MLNNLDQKRKMSFQLKRLLDEEIDNWLDYDHKSKSIVNLTPQAKIIRDKEETIAYFEEKGLGDEIRILNKWEKELKEGD